VPFHAAAADLLGHLDAVGRPSLSSWIRQLDLGGPDCAETLLPLEGRFGNCVS